MTREEKIQAVQALREREGFGLVTPEELESLPGSETEMGSLYQELFTVNRTNGWEQALELHI